MWHGKSMSVWKGDELRRQRALTTHPPFSHPNVLHGGDVCGRLGPVKLLSVPQTSLSGS